MVLVGRLMSELQVGTSLVIDEGGSARITSPVVAIKPTRRGKRILTRSGCYFVDAQHEVYILGVSCSICGRIIGAADPIDHNMCLRCGRSRGASIVIDQDSIDTVA